ncbi:MAG: molybdopterin synthase sulfur carrier subunit [Candidatus Rokuibacteriota bacterium]|nr:MAG: molybdopterin synthase sulfur carrier subunit [Candidatus Rokubacteria bacterium]
MRTSSRPAAAVSPTASKQHVRVRVRLFARYREATGHERLDVDVPEGGTVETAWKAIVARHPDLARYRPYTLFAVGHNYVEPDHRLGPDDELCLFPPVSGGASL